MEDVTGATPMTFWKLPNDPNWDAEKSVDPSCIADFPPRDPRGQHLGDFEFGKEDKLLNCGVSNGGSNPLVDIS
jgi:hypothetical protein